MNTSPIIHQQGADCRFKGWYYVSLYPRGYLLNDGTMTERPAGNEALYYFKTTEEAGIAVITAKIKGVIP